METKTISKSLFAIIILTLPIMIGVLAFSKKKQLKKRSFDRENIMLNEFTFFEKDGSEFDLQNLAEDKKTLVIIFSKDCDMCRMEIQNIKVHYEKIADSNILFIGANNEGTYELLKETPLDLLANKNVKLLHDNMGMIYRKLKLTSAPSILIFDQNGKIDTIYEGYHAIEPIAI